MEQVMNEHTECSCRDQIRYLESQRRSGNFKLQQCLMACHKNKGNVKHRSLLQQKSPRIAKHLSKLAGGIFIVVP